MSDVGNPEVVVEISVEAGGLSGEVSKSLSELLAKAATSSGTTKQFTRKLEQLLIAAGKAGAKGYGKGFATQLDVEVAKLAAKAAKIGVELQKEVNKGQLAAQRQATARTRATQQGLTTRTESNNRALIVTSQIRAQERVIQAQARLKAAEAEVAAAQAALNKSQHEGTRAAAGLLNATARLEHAQNELQLSLEATSRAEKRLEAARVSSSSRLKLQSTRDLEATNRLEAGRLNAQRAQTEASVKLQVEAARRARQLDVAEAQQDEKRKTLRLQRFNALALQVTQAGFTKLRDARRNAASREIIERQSQDKRMELQLRETMSRREAIIRQAELRIQQRQSKSTANLLQQQTSTGVLGAARGVSPFGASLRSLALLGGGALSIRAIFNSAQDFLANFRRLGAITEATDAQMAALRKTSIALGNDLSLPGVSAGDAAESLTRLVQAGFSVDQAIGAAKGTLLLARNNLLDFGEAAQFTGSAINAFSISADKAVAIVDIAQRSLVSGGGQSFTELAQAVQQSGAVFAQFYSKIRGGQTAFEDLNIALDILAKNGLRGSDAGTSLKTFLLSLTGTSAKAREEIAKLGAKVGLVGGSVGTLFFDAAGQVRPFTEVISNLRKALGDLTQEQQLEKLKQVFGTDAFRAASIFIGQTDEQLAAFESTIRSATGTSEQLGRAVNQGMRAAFDNFSSVIETAGILLVEKIDKPLGKVINQFANLTSSLIQGQGVYKVVRDALGGIAIALGGILLAKGAIEVLGATKSILIGMASPAKLAVVAIAGLAAAINIGRNSSDEFRDSLGQLGAFVEQNVIGPFARLGNTIRTALFGDDASGGARGKLNAAQQELLPDALGRVRKSQPAFDAIGRVISGSIVPALETAARFIRETAIPAFFDLVRFVREQVFPVFVRVGVLIADVGKLIGAEIVARALPALRTLGQGLREGFTGLAEGAQASGVIGFLQDVARAVGGVGAAVALLFQGDFRAAGSRLASLGRSIGSALLDSIRGIDFAAIGLAIFKGLGAAARKLGSASTTLFSEPVLKAILGAAAAVLAVAGQVAVNFVIGFAQGMKGRIDDITRVIADILKLAIPAAFKLASVAIRAALTGLIKAAFSGPIGLAFAALATTIAVAFSAKLLGKLRTGFFKPLVAMSRASFKVLRGDTNGAIESYKLYQGQLRRTQFEQRALNAELGGTRFGKALVGIKGAQDGFGRFHDSILRTRLALSGLAAQFLAGGGFAGVIQSVGRRVQGSFAEMFALDKYIRSTRTSGQQIGGALAAGLTSGLSGFSVGQANDGISKILGIAGVLGGVTAGFASAGFAGAAFAGVTGVVGLALGTMSKRAREAQERMAAFSDGMKSGATYAESFAAGIDKVVEKNKKLGDSLALAGIEFDQVLAQIQQGGRIQIGSTLGQLATRIANDINNLDVSNLRSAFDELGTSAGLLPAEIGAAQAAINRFDKTARDATAAQDLTNTLDDLLTTARSREGLAQSDLGQFSQLINEVSKAAKSQVINEALAFDVKKVSTAFGEAIAQGKNLTDTLSTLIPDNLEFVLRFTLGQPLEDVLGILQGSAPKLEAFRAALRNAVDQGVLKEANAQAIELFIQNMIGGFDSAALSASKFREEAAGVARQVHLDKIAADWHKIEDAARDAADARDLYFGGFGGTTQERADQALLQAKEGFEGITQFIKDNKIGDLNLVAGFNTGALGAQARQALAGVTQPIEDFLANLPDDVKANRDAAARELDKIIGPLRTEAIAAGVDPKVFDLAINRQALLDSLQPYVTAARDIGIEMRKVIREQLAKPTTIDQATGAVLFGGPQSASVLAEIAFDPKVDQTIKDFFAAHPVETSAAINEVLVDQTAADSAVSTAVATAASKLPPLKMRGTITEADISDRALQALSLRLRIAGNQGGRQGALFNSSEGNIFTRPSITSIAEGGRAEAVIPLTKPKRALQLLRRSGLARLLLGGTMGAIDLTSAGQNVGEGAALGLTQSQGLVAKAASGLASTISSTFTRLLGIHSPSTVFEKYGRDIIDGLIKGLTEGAQAAGDSVRGFVDILFGKVTSGGSAATGFDQLAAAVREQVGEALREVGSEIASKTSAQAQALEAIAGLTNKDQLKSFKGGFNPNTTTGAANRSAVIQAIEAAREAILTNVEQGDTTGAQAVLDALRGNLKKAADQGATKKVDAENLTVLNQLLGQFGLGGANPVADLTNEFARATEELRKLIDAENARIAERASLDRPTVEQHNEINVTTYDPMIVANRITRITSRELAKALQ